MKKTWKRLCMGFLALATVVTALPTTPVHAESKQYWTESAERVGIIEKVMNDGSIGSTFNEGYMKVEGETAYCIDINTDFKNGYKTRADASSRMSADQISDVALSLGYVKQYGETHKELNYKQVYLLEQCVVWQRLSVHLGWQCDNVRASYDEIPKATQDEVFAGARAFVKENKGRYECGGYIYSGEGQELGQFWAKLNVGNAKLQKTSSNTSITDGNGNYSIAGATYGVFSDKDCTKQLATLTTDENGNTDAYCRTYTGVSVWCRYTQSLKNCYTPLIPDRPYREMRWSDERKDKRCVHKKEDFPLSQNGSVRGGTLPYPAFTSGDGSSCDGACGRYHKRRKSLLKISAFQLPA